MCVILEESSRGVAPPTSGVTVCLDILTSTEKCCSSADSLMKGKKTRNVATEAGALNQSLLTVCQVRLRRRMPQEARALNQSLLTVGRVRLRRRIKETHIQQLQRKRHTDTHGAKWTTKTNGETHTQRRPSREYDAHGAKPQYGR